MGRQAVLAGDDKAAKAGVDESYRLDYHILHPATGVIGNLSHQPAISFLVPNIRHCNDLNETETCAMQNLLRLDAVAVSESEDDILLQLRYHAPAIIDEREKLPQPLPVSPIPPEQRFSEGALSALRSDPIARADLRVYSLARRIAKARTVRSRYLDDTLAASCIVPTTA